MSAGDLNHGLTSRQVLHIAEKYGAFEYGDAQGDKRLAFAADVIAARQRIRDAAPELLAALIEAEFELRVAGAADRQDADFVPTKTLVWRQVCAAIAKATQARPW